MMTKTCGTDINSILSIYNELQQKKTDRLNQEAGNLPGFECEKCKNRGFSAYVSQDGDIIAKECSCMIRRRAEARMIRSGLGDLLEKCTFETYEATDKPQKNALSLAKDFLEKKESCPWFFVSGKPGTGKTHLCTAICKELLASGYDVRYMMWRDDSRRMKAYANDGPQYDSIVNPVKRVQVLYIDDFFKSGKKDITTPDITLAFDIINERYNHSDSITIISTEFSIRELILLDNALGSRIYEKSKDFSLDFSAGRNYRLQK